MGENKYIEVPVSTKDGPLFALIDSEDEEAVKKQSWSLMSKGYALGGRRPHVLMHRMILNAKRGQIVDHINGDKLDNRRNNLRLTSNSVNIQRAKKFKHTNGYRGVRKTKTGWQAYGKQDGKYKYIGTYTSEKDAALAYNKFARKKYGELTFQNEVNNG